jgi:Zn-dependent M28 family amino/carboxypeptidase
MLPIMPDDADLSERLRLHVDRLAGLIGPRHLGKPKSFEAAATYVERELAKHGDAVVREAYAIDDHEVANYYVERRGTTKPEQIVIIGAHYDTVSTTPGADDNASAVAVLLEVLGLLRDCKPNKTIRFISFACEEPPYFWTNSMGSQVHALNCRKRNEQITAMFCLEMLGYYSDEPNSQKLPDGIPRWLGWAFPKRGNFLASVGNLKSIKAVWDFRRGFKRGSKLPLFSIALPEMIQSIRLSDNSSFWDQGYPALMITDTSFLRNPHYHQPSDLPETLDYDRMAQATRGIASAMEWLAR